MIVDAGHPDLGWSNASTATARWGVDSEWVASFTNRLLVQSASDILQSLQVHLIFRTESILFWLPSSSGCADQSRSHPRVSQASRGRNLGTVSAQFLQGQGFAWLFWHILTMYVWIIVLACNGIEYGPFGYAVHPFPSLALLNMVPVHSKKACG